MPTVAAVLASTTSTRAPGLTAGVLPDWRFCPPRRRDQPQMPYNPPGFASWPVGIQRNADEDLRPDRFGWSGILWKPLYDSLRPPHEGLARDLYEGGEYPVRCWFLKFDPVRITAGNWVMVHTNLTIDRYLAVSGVYVGNLKLQHRTMGAHKFEIFIPEDMRGWVFQSVNQKELSLDLTVGPGNIATYRFVLADFDKLGLLYVDSSTVTGEGYAGDTVCGPHERYPAGRARAPA